jgi:hypothetical protein
LNQAIRLGDALIAETGLDHGRGLKVEIIGRRSGGAADNQAGDGQNGGEEKMFALHGG